MNDMNEKKLLTEKYKLVYENHAYYSDRENSHKHLIFKEAFFERSDIIGLLFRINKLCMAKVRTCLHKKCVRIFEHNFD